MPTLSAYLQTWRLKLSHTKTVTAAFHLNNREAKRELKVYNNGRLLPFCPTPTYLGVKLDRSLTFRHHLVALRKKLSSRVTLLRRLVVSGWGCCHLISSLLNSWVLCASLASQCSHLSHRKCLERRLAHSYCMPASHSNGPPTCTLRSTPASWASPTGSDTLLGLPWLTVDLWTPIISCMVF